MAISKKEKEYFLSTLNNIKEKRDLKNFIYDLYVTHRYSHQSIVTIIRQKSEIIDIQTIIKILEDFDVKRCINYKNCKSPDGYVQSRSNFFKSSATTDNKETICSYCKSFSNIYKKANVEKQKHMIFFQLLHSKEEKNEYIIQLQIKYNYNYSEIRDITCFPKSDIVNIIKSYGYKKCKNKDNCNSPEGPIQNFNSFYYLSNSPDGFDYVCIHCRKFYTNFDQSKTNLKRKHMLEFQKTPNQEMFLLELYKKGFSIYHLTAISLNGIKYIIKLLEKHDIKKCSNPSCKDPIQSRRNFNKLSNSIDNLSNQCKNCQYKYCGEFAKYNTYASQIDFVENVRRDLNNTELIQTQCKTCKEWFNPTNRQLRTRINAINGYNTSIGTENNLYCSDTCKNSCPLYNSQVSQLITQQRLRNNNLRKKDFKRIQSELRSYFLKIRNPDRCELCDKEANQEDLILHHKIPVVIDYVLEADDYNVVFVCQECDKLAHQKDGCKTGQLAQFSIEDKLC